MDLIDRYLAAVGALLPRSQRADITAELRDILMNHREEKEAEQGRPLTRDEEAALLVAFGHPLAVAGRYGRQQYLIGPEYFPLYSLALKILIAIVVAGAVLSMIVSIAVNPQGVAAAIHGAAARALNGAISVVGSLTIVAAILQHHNVHLKFLDRWDPKELPAFPKWRRRRETWVNHVAAVIWLTAIGLWWAGLFAFPPVNYAHAGGGTLTLNYGSIHQALYGPVLALIGGMIVIHLIRLLGRLSEKAGYALDILVQLATVSVAAIALKAGHWVDVGGSGLALDSLAKVRQGVNVGIHIAIFVIVVVAAATAVWDGWRIVRSADRAFPL